MANRIIPFFSVREINTVKDYERFYHLKSYIQDRSRMFVDDGRKTDVLIHLMEQSLYAKLQKFRAHRIEWDNLERDIPLGYLEAIGADRQTMIDLVARDRAEFEEVVQLPFFPSCAVIRYMACVYGTLKFPAGTTEATAIEICQTKKMNLCINYPGIKSVFIESGGNVIRRYYPPEIRFTKNRLTRRGDGRGIGTAYI